MKTYLQMLILFLLFSFDGSAITKTYNTVSGNWNVDANWTPIGVPTINDDVIIPSGDTVTITTDAEAKSISISGTLSMLDGFRLTIGSHQQWGDFTVNSGGSFTMPGGSAQSILVVYGNYNNNGSTDFWKSTVIIAGDLISPATSELQKQGNIIVGGNIIGDFDLTGGNGIGQIYAVNTNAIVTITPTSIDNNVIPGDTINSENQALTDLVNSILYGNNTCSFEVNDVLNFYACITDSNAVFMVSTTGGSPVYQWQINDGSGWFDLNNNATYSGVLTNALTINMLTGLDGKKYRAKVTSEGCTKNGDYGTLSVTTIAPAAPVAITGTSPQCPSNSGQLYSIAAVYSATSYIWTVPTGWTIDAGQGTTSIFVTTGAIGIGNITVKASNGCGTSLAKNKSVTVVASTVTSAGTVSGGATYCSYTNGPTTLTVSGYTSGAIVLRWESSIDNFATTTIIANTTTTLTVTDLSLTASYRAILKKSSGCPEDSFPATIVIGIPDEPIIGTISQPSCTVSTGSIMLTGLPSGSWTIYQSGTVSATYSGNTTSYTISGLGIGTYSFTVKNSLGCTSSSTSDVVLIPSVTVIWDGSGWSPSAPTINDAIIFNGDYSSTGDISGCTLQLNFGTVVINTGHTLTLTNGITVLGGSLTFENNASLLQINDNASNTGNITYKRITTPVRKFDYTYWSSPVNRYTLGGVSPNTLSDKYYSFDPNTNYWAQESAATMMITGKGYIIRAPNNYDLVTATTFQASFIGVPNNGVYTYTGINSDKFYLMGNPYASAIDADKFLDDNAGVLDGTIYLWTHNTTIINNAYTPDDYASYNRVGGTGTAATTSGVNNSIPSGKIASGQAFFTAGKTGVVNGTVLFNNSMRISGGLSGINNSQFFKFSSSFMTTKNIEKHRVWLNFSNNSGVFKQTLIGYTAGATNEFDSNFDGESFDGNEFADFYSICQNKNLVIQGRVLPFNENDEVPLGYTTTIDGQFNISLDNYDGLFSGIQDIYLLDNKTGSLHNLKEGAYTFTTSIGAFNDRFELRYSKQSLGNQIPSLTGAGVKLITNNHEFSVLSSSALITKVQVFDVLGKSINNYDNLRTNNFQTSALQLSPQILFIRITLDNGQTFIKKMLMQ